VTRGEGRRAAWLPDGAGAVGEDLNQAGLEAIAGGRGDAGGGGTSAAMKTE